ncbi:MAG: tRNA (adenosine(37)-N6)-threonylcarbamoyltransferase complex ATPase subunit type 1 TsaE [Propionibacteriaceae bacterium]|jgi:tRNA threonylcarbamoyladenosine biosynthesis protein TsaE|nr:tRNA (adenosine(37)-N6)-threonylcarbamoyltransferase complex ATPase subunit type 1 TsaE [Propionibacteriaceae bacterium]
MNLGPIRIAVSTAEDMHTLGRDLARLLLPGDLIILTGELGAGKTQLTQGIGEGLDVQGAVISPTFVLSRIHRSSGTGPALVHVDAYRLASSYEVDDLDLEQEMPFSVTVVEWGKGLVDHLSENRLEIEILRSPDIENETRSVEIMAVGSRWESLIDQWQAFINEDMGRDAQADAQGDSDD